MLFSSYIIANTTIKPFSGKFVQTVTNTNNKVITYKGDIFVNSSQQILWKYKSPTIKNIYLTHTSVIVEEPELEQAIYTSIQNSLNISQILKNATKISDSKYETIINEISYTILLNGEKIRQIQYGDQLDNKIVITFFSVKNNPTYPANFFRFIPKEYYDIIHK